MTESRTQHHTPTQTHVQTCNEVVLVGRVSAAPERRELPSGDLLVTLRVVVDRPPQKGVQRKAPGPAKRSVDVIDVACWTRRTQRTAEGLSADDGVRVEGALRRRFFAAGGGRASRYEVEAARLVRVNRAGGPAGG
jgi:single-strand DNA-binding protein